MSSLQVGSIVEGVVTGITNFGAFVLLPNGETGLVHISEVADSYVKDINEHLQKKDKIKVKILSVNGDGKVGLSIRRASPVERKEYARRGSRMSGSMRMSFEDKISKFMKESDEKQQDLRKNTDSKRGGGRSYRHSFD
ncbi:MAG TPA: S1 RNA-binding domain-containing protein [Firmicutes bacterium]|jgi:S1 RNA binding domain protein|nr:S1 RNA-binding domain-containing protein [Bacillota bacterium]